VENAREARDTNVVEEERQADIKGKGKKRGGEKREREREGERENKTRVYQHETKLD